VKVYFSKVHTGEWATWEMAVPPRVGEFIDLPDGFSGKVLKVTWKEPPRSRRAYVDGLEAYVIFVEADVDMAP
jgi:hypothetical protein